MTPSLDEEISGYLASKEVDGKADYFARGRAYQILSKEELTQRYVATFRSLANNPLDAEKRLHLGFEFDLRGEESPSTLVKEYINQYCSKTLAAFEEVEQSDPDRYWQMAQGLEDDILSEKCDFMPGGPNNCKFTGGTGKFAGLQADVIITAGPLKSNYDGIAQIIGHKKGTYKIAKTN